MSERHSYSGQELPAPKVVDRGEGAVGRDGFPAVFTDIQKVVAFYVCRAFGKPPGNTGFKERPVDGPEDSRDVVEGDFLFHTSLMFLDVQGQR